jgi:hypothetical protein
MKLTDLDPRWYVFEDGGPRVGLTFECPCCLGTDKATRIGVVFHKQGHEAIDDAYILARHPDEKIWTMVGPDNFSILTLTPSIDASHVGHWHGFVTNGEAR